MGAIQKVSSNDFNVSATFTRPNDTTAYAAGDVVGTSPATNMTFSNISPIAGSGYIIMGAFLRIDVSSITGMANFRLHLYSSAPTAIADNSAFDLASGDRSKYLGYISFDTPEVMTSTAFIASNNVNMKRTLASGSTTIYGLLETRSAYTPSANAVFTLTISGVGA